MSVPDFIFTNLMISQILMTWIKSDNKTVLGGFPGGSVIKNLPANAGDTGLIPDPGRSHMTNWDCVTTIKPVL